MTHPVSGSTPQVFLENISSNQEVKKGEIQFTQAEPPEKLPDTHAVGGNTMKALENLLWKKCGSDLGFDTSQPLSDEKARNDFLKRIRKHIKGFHGRLPRKDSSNVESSIEFETYRHSAEQRDGKTIYGAKCLKLKMRWQIELEIDGKKMIVEADQYIKTSALVPEGIAKLPPNLRQASFKPYVKMAANLEHAKHSALLTAKFVRNLHKKGFMGEISKSSKQKVYSDQLVTNLRAPEGFRITHYPNPTTFNQKFSQRLWSPDLRKEDGVAHYSAVLFKKDNTHSSMIYTSEFGGAGRTKKAVQPGEEGKLYGQTTEKVGKHFHKVILRRVPREQRDEVVSYGEHLYNQASQATIKDLEQQTYDTLAASSREDANGKDTVSERLKRAQAELDKRWNEEELGPKAILTASRLKAYELSCFMEKQKELENLEASLKEKLQPIPLPLPLPRPAPYLLKRLLLKQRLANEKANFDKIIERLENCKLERRQAETDEEKQSFIDNEKALEHKLKKAYTSMKQVHADIEKMKDFTAQLSRIHAHIKQLENHIKQNEDGKDELGFALSKTGLRRAELLLDRYESFGKTLDNAKEMLKPTFRTQSS